MSLQSRRAKRQRAAGQLSAEGGLDGGTGSLAALRGFLQRALTINATPSDALFEPGKPGERERLIAVLWSGEFAAPLEQLSAAHPELSYVLEILTGNTYTARGFGAAGRARRRGGILAVLVRAKSQKQTTLLTAILSILAEQTTVKSRFHDAVAFFFRGIVAEAGWTRELIAEAALLRPPPAHPRLRGFALGAIDNFQMRADYKALATTEASGYLMSMTNAVFISGYERLAPPDFNSSALCTAAAPPPVHPRRR